MILFLYLLLAAVALLGGLVWMIKKFYWGDGEPKDGEFF
jgi:hypothetical protein